ncbi:related to CFT1 [Lecanosticta acicola]|uniref:DNA damage-binding protein 1 n=1 Tax=Lecanosticta acicola TaxID=111012 RepID=A0AAI8Z1Q7_9PEZI|nr:related to CFT1 [Lecanosticta acicola]
MQCYTELVPPTAVTHAVALPFLGPNERNLVVAKTSLLQVFNVTRLRDGREKLSLVGEYSLSGTVSSIARVKTLDTKSGGEAVLLAFKDAKLSLLEWDKENYRTSTISIHYYEAENVRIEPFGPTLAECENILTVDPSSRCAALKFGAKQLAILPFRQFGDELVGDEQEQGLDAVPASATVKTQESVPQDGEGEHEETPYKASFVLPTTALDPTLSHTVSLAFLHEYREPTFGILAAPVEPSLTLLDERKDVLTYTVFTLDLEQKASTNLITVPKLPSTLWKVIPLALPIGGALLVGTNELVHIDQSGKANATAVNEFAKLESDFGMVDQSHLSLKLEHCCIEALDPKTGELLMVLYDGSLATISFQTMGRSISALNVTKISGNRGGYVVSAAPSCLTRVDGGKMFVGSEDGSSSLLGWSRPTASLSRKRSHAQMRGKEPDDDDDDDEAVEEDDDDLYDAEPETKKRALSSAELNSAEMAASFALKDTLPSIAPINDACVGRPGDFQADKLQLLVGSGRGEGSKLSCMSRDIVTNIKRTTRMDNARAAWAIRTKDSVDGYDNLLFVYNGNDTKPHDLTSATTEDDAYTERPAPEFESEGETLDVQTLAEGKIIVQVRRSELRTYDAKLALNQIIPMVDDETDEEFNIVHVSFCDPFVLVVRDNSSVQVLQVQGREIEPLEAEGAVSGSKWLGGCVYSGSFTQGTPALFLLGAESGMHIFNLPALEEIYVAPTLRQLPPLLTTDPPQRRAGPKEALTELLVADLGVEGVTQPYLALRTAIDDIVLYEPFTYAQNTASDTWYANLRFRKVPFHYIPKYNEAIAADESTRPLPLKALHVGDSDTIMIPGAPPSLLLKDASSLPKTLEVRPTRTSTHVAVLSAINRPGCENGFIAIEEEGSLTEAQLPTDTWYGTGWSVKQMSIGEGASEVRHLAYHETRGMFVVATSRDVDFYFAEEDGRHSEQDDISLRPQVPQYTIHLISSRSYRIIHSFNMPYLETVTALQVMPLEVSEHSHVQELRIVVATAAQRGEDMPAKGAIAVFDVLDVVPEPDVPESGYKLHVVAREESRGAITALAAFPGGFIGTAQGQKIMIRGLKEDGSCLPVAFLDAQCHTSTIKTLGSKGMWLAGDAWKGLWFGAWTEEPYKLNILGRSPKTKMEVMAADFLPFDGTLHLLIMDADMRMHVLQYAPEDPSTQNGLRLVHKSTFHVGNFVTKMMLVPSTLAPTAEQQVFANGETEEQQQQQQQREEDEEPQTLFHVLTTSLSGSIGLVTPLDESSYRRLSQLQGHLTSILEHTAGLNPRAYRGETGGGVGGGKGIVDGNLVRRIQELGAARKSDVLSRAGADMWGLRSDLEIIGGGGLGYL